MERKYKKTIQLLPATSSEMLHQIDLLIPSDSSINKAQMCIVKQCSMHFYNNNLTQSQEIAEEILDISWESLNTGHWKDVPDTCRAVYSIGSLFKALSTAGLMVHSTGDSDLSAEICRLCDMALLMGAPIFDGIFYKIIDIYKPAAQKRKIDDCVEKERKRSFPSSIASDNIRLRKDHEIPILSSPSLETFRRCMEMKQPVILQGCIEHWPARARWSPDYLKQVAGHRTVPVEVGTKYTDDEWGQQLMTVASFVDKYISSDRITKGYLAQHQLFDQIPELRNDIVVPDYCSITSHDGDRVEDDGDDDVNINAWFGPAGTVSPCHHDPKHNLLAQVVGRKYVRLFEPQYSACLYPHAGASVLTNTSQVDVENPDLLKFPKFQEVDDVHCQEHLLLPGQVLYIPPKHWHYIRSLDISFSVSFWWE